MAEDEIIQGSHPAAYKVENNVSAWFIVFVDNLCPRRHNFDLGGQHRLIGIQHPRMQAEILDKDSPHSRIELMLSVCDDEVPNHYSSFASCCT